MSDPKQGGRADEDTVAGTIDAALENAYDGALDGDRDEPLDEDLDGDLVDGAAADEQAAREGTKGLPEGEI
ncbi:hypothetical protein [Microbacterium sp. SS28]|uniref:hypothetical protein n=1 Tax=Microbacterium sp. SS28 TaxID=2919948 RepID=UPI001FAAB7FA|nr:hypothetical protein [Microbacterium sp. SS28]